MQPGGSLYGLQHSNPVDPTLAYAGNAGLFGTPNDPLVGQRVGGVNVFGGGWCFLSTGGKKVGGVGVSGDTSCTDHMVAWRVWHALNLDHFGPAATPVGGVSGSASYPDNIILDITPTPDGGLLNPMGTLSQSPSGFGHPTCLNPPNFATLPVVQNRDWSIASAPDPPAQSIPSASATPTVNHEDAFGLQQSEPKPCTVTTTPDC